MKGPYHTRGLWWGLIRQPVWHLREYSRNEAYRALHRFHRQLRRVPRFTRSEVLFAGLPIQICDAPSFLSAWDEIFVNRIYDIGNTHHPTLSFVDAGANIGLAALYWKSRYNKFNYVGFEPDPSIAACCRENLRRWSIQGDVLEVAVGGNDGEAHFQNDGADGGRVVGNCDIATQGFSVPMRRLAPYLSAPVDLLKIDVEGAEADVLIDIAPCLGCVRSIFVEWHSRAGRPGLGRAISILEAAGFDCHMHVANCSPQPFVRPQPHSEYFQNLNIYAVRP